MTKDKETKQESIPSVSSEVQNPKISKENKNKEVPAQLSKEDWEKMNLEKRTQWLALNRTKIGTETWKNIAKYYGCTKAQLVQIAHMPKLYDVSSPYDFNSLTILEFIKNGIIKPEELLLATDKKEESLEELYNVINVCCDLRDEFSSGIGMYSQNNPSQYPEFLKNLIASTIKKGPDSWIETNKFLSGKKDGKLTIYLRGVKGAVNDYVNTVFIPHHLQLNENSDIVLLTRDGTPTTPSKTPTEFFEQTITKFLKDVPLDGIFKLSDRWHEHGKQAELRKAKTFAGNNWEPLFLGVPPTYEVEGKKITIVPLTNPAALLKEGNDLNHCIGGFAEKCLLGYRSDRGGLMSSHILSFRDESGNALSTLELEVIVGCMVGGKIMSRLTYGENVIIEQGKHDKLVKREHRGKDDIPDQSEEAEELFFKDLRSGKIKVDLVGLEEARRNRVETFTSDDKSKTLMIVGYDHTDKTKDENGETPLERATRIYREIGLDNGKKDLPLQLTRNFDELLSVVVEEKKETKQADPTMNKVDRKTCLKIKNHIFKICGSDQPNFSKNDVNVTSEKNKLYIKISAKPLGNNLFSPSSKALTNLADILKSDQSIKTSDESGAKLITFKIDINNLQEIMKILEDKAPLSPKDNVTKTTVEKLKGPKPKDEKHQL